MHLNCLENRKLLHIDGIRVSCVAKTTKIVTNVARYKANNKYFLFFFFWRQCVDLAACDSACKQKLIKIAKIFNWRTKHKNLKCITITSIYKHAHISYAHVCVRVNKCRKYKYRFSTKFCNCKHNEIWQMNYSFNKVSAPFVNCVCVVVALAAAISFR